MFGDANLFKGIWHTLCKNRVYGSSTENMSLLSKSRLAHETNSISAALAKYLLDNFSLVKQYTHEINKSRDYLKSELAKQYIVKLWKLSVARI